MHNTGVMDEITTSLVAAMRRDELLVPPHHLNVDISKLSRSCFKPMEQVMTHGEEEIVLQRGRRRLFVMICIFDTKEPNSDLIAQVR